jgi:hypothetical protein
MRWTLDDMSLLPIVTGAPGAGKSAAVEAFLKLRTEHLAFDIDWLAAPASDLAGSAIYFDASTWPAYNRVWFEVLHAVHRNGQTPVLFAPLDEDDLRTSGFPDWCDGIRWLLLDCADHVRTQRLAARSWDDERIAEAITDADLLRRIGTDHIDTGRHRPLDVAHRIHDWLRTQR